MIFSSLRHIILLALASLLMNRAASQVSISPFLAASASKKTATKKADSRLPENLVMISGWSPGTTVKSQIPFSSIRPNTYAATMAWTCRQELRLEKFLTLPLKISLGSKEQVDWLEGKNQMPR
jgi:hypothetical protein